MPDSLKNTASSPTVPSIGRSLLPAIARASEYAFLLWWDRRLTRKEENRWRFAC